MLTYKDDPELFNQKAEILKALAHPIRLCIVKGLLESGGSNVTNMYTCLDAPQSTISQHISKLKAARIIKGEKRGLEIFYTVISQEAKNIIKGIF